MCQMKKVLSFLVSASLLLFASTALAADQAALNKQLMMAIKDGNSNAVTRVIGMGANVNETDADGALPLTVAARHGQTEIVKLLLQNGASVTAVNTLTGSTALINAAGSGNVETIKALLEAGSDINARNDKGKSAIDIAFDLGNPAAFHYLRQHGATLDAQSLITKENMRLAIVSNKPGTVKILLDLGMDPNGLITDRLPAILGAAMKKHIAVAKVLLDAGANPNVVVPIENKYRLTPLEEAATGNDCSSALVELLLNAGAELEKSKPLLDPKDKVTFLQAVKAAKSNKANMAEYNKIIALLEKAEAEQKAKAKEKK